MEYLFKTATGPISPLRGSTPLIGRWHWVNNYTEYNTSGNFYILNNAHFFRDIMARKGGTAVDAAIAAILCQCVHNTYGCGIGGGHFMTVYNRYAP